MLICSQRVKTRFLDHKVQGLPHECRSSRRWYYVLCSCRTWMKLRSLRRAIPLCFILYFIYPDQSRGHRPCILLSLQQSRLLPSFPNHSGSLTELMLITVVSRAVMPHMLVKAYVTSLRNVPGLCSAKYTRFDLFYLGHHLPINLRLGKVFTNKPRTCSTR